MLNMLEDIYSISMEILRGIMLRYSYLLFFLFLPFLSFVSKADDIKNSNVSVDQPFTEKATRCMGVYLFDLPKEFTVYPGTEFHYDNIRHIVINTQKQDLPSFKQMIANRKQKLKDTKPIHKIDGNFLKAIYPLSGSNVDKKQGIIFERMESEGIDDVRRILEGYRWKDGVTFKIEMKAFNGSASRYDKDRERYPDVYENDVSDKLAHMNKLFDRIHARDDFTVPTDVGFCFPNGFMQGGIEEYKEISTLYRDKNYENLAITIHSHDYSDEIPLLKEPREPGGHTVYKGKRKNNNMVMEEWIQKGRYFDRDDHLDDYLPKDKGYLFRLGINAFDADYKKPQLRVEMYYILPRDSSKAYSKKQLMTIWREITNSIRIRESSFTH